MKITLLDTPTGKVGNHRMYVEAEMVQLLKDMAQPWGKGDVPVVIETQQAMPKQGVTSTFSIGYGYGLWRGIIAALGQPVYPVRPLTWKGVMLRGMAKDKGASVIRAAQLVPESSALLRGPRGGFYDGRAEALLLALYGRQELSLSGPVIGIDPGLSGAIAIIDL